MERCLGSRARVLGGVLGGLLVSASPGVAAAQEPETEQAREPPTVREAPTKAPAQRPLVGPWVDVESGGARVSLKTFAVDQSGSKVGMRRTVSGTPLAGLGLGLRIAGFTGGVRTRVALGPGWKLWSAGGELGLRAHTWKLEPHLELGGGYVAVADVREGEVAQGIAPVSGYYARVAAGLGWSVYGALQLGLRGSWEVLGLTPEDPVDTNVKALGRRLLSGDVDGVWAEGRKLGGMGYGAVLGASATLGLRF